MPRDRTVTAQSSLPTVRNWTKDSFRRHARTCGADTGAIPARSPARCLVSRTTSASTRVRADAAPTSRMPSSRATSSDCVAHLNRVRARATSGSRGATAGWYRRTAARPSSAQSNAADAEARSTANRDPARHDRDGVRRRPGPQLGRTEQRPLGLDHLPRPAQRGVGRRDVVVRLRQERLGEPGSAAHVELRDLVPRGERSEERPRAGDIPSIQSSPTRGDAQVGRVRVPSDVAQHRRDPDGPVEIPVGGCAEQLCLHDRIARQGLPRRPILGRQEGPRHATVCGGLGEVGRRSGEQAQ